MSSPSSHSASRMNAGPASSTTLPSANLPMRIFGPCRSAMIATSRPSLLRALAHQRARARRGRRRAPCEKLRRTTSTPAASMRCRTAGSLQAGPSVATILVLRGTMALLRVCRPRIRPRRRASSQALRDRRQRLALEEFEERAAAGRDVADPVGDAELGDRGERVAAAGDRERVRCRDRLGDGLRAAGERVELEHADRPVPDDRAGLGDDRLQRRHRSSGRCRGSGRRARRSRSP